MNNTLTENDFTTADHLRYAELLQFLQSADYPSEHFDTCCEFVRLRDKAIACGLDVDPLPF